jgi:hypothetical protein
MMCSHAKELLAVSWQGELAAADARELEEHLAACAECSAEAVSLGGLWNRLGDMPAPEPSPALDARWNSTLEALMSAQQPIKNTASSKSSFTGIFAAIWPRNPVWQAAFAMACLVAGVLIGTNMPRQNKEIAKLHEEIANTREMVALSLLQQQSATERLRGVSYTGNLPTMEPQVVSALTDAVAHDPNVNVRLAAVDALSKASGSPGVLQSLTQSLPRQDSPMVQAAIVDYLVDARDRRAVGTLRTLASQPDLNPAVLERTHFALQQLSK